MNSSNQVKSQIMKAAWAQSKYAAGKFGGNPSQYFAESLKSVWLKARSVTAVRIADIAVSVKSFREQVKVLVGRQTQLDLTFIELIKAQVLGLIKKEELS